MRPSEWAWDRGAEGPLDAEIVLVGEAWGAEEEKVERPFVGKAGHLLDTILSGVPFDRSRLRVTNFVKDHPPENDISPYFQTCRKAEYERLGAEGCLTAAVPKGWDAMDYDYYALTPLGMEARGALLSELACYGRARVIVALGASATFALTGRAPIMKVRGSPLIVPSLPPVLPALHPSFILRSSYVYRYTLLQDFRKAVEMAVPAFRLPQRTLLHSPSLDEVLSELERLRLSDLVAFDIETVGNTIVCIGFSNRPDWAICVPLMGYYGLDEARVREAVGLVLASPGTKLAQNIIFDRSLLEKEGFTFGGASEDTMVLHSIAYPEVREIKGNALDALCAKYTFEPFYKEDGKVSRRLGDFQQLREYNCKDACVTMEVWQKMAHLRDDPDHLRTYRFTMSMLEPALGMMYRGLLVDEARRSSMLEALDRQIASYQGELDRLAGWEVNPHAAAHMKKLLYGQLGVKPFTKVGGRETCDDEALSRMAAGTASRPPIREATLVQAIRRIWKDKAYLGSPKKPRSGPWVDADGRHRTSYNLRGTYSLRFSTKAAFNGTGGPHQILPPAFQGVVIPTPGHFFWAQDKEKAEWAAVAVISGDANMLQCLREGRDPYAWTASLATGLPYEVVLQEHKLGNKLTSPEEFTALRATMPAFLSARCILPDWTVRAMYKEACLAFNYMMTAETFSLGMGISLPIAKTIRAAYLRAYPGIPRWWSSVEFQLRSSRPPVTRTTMGIKVQWMSPVTLPNGKVNAALLRQAVNIDPQSTVNWITKEGLLFAHRHSRLIPLIERHDEVFGEYSFSEIEHFLEDSRDLSAAMSRPLVCGGRTLVISNELKVGAGTWRGMQAIPFSATLEELKRTLEGTRK